jgi:glycosyltransferase involved in cell wall biosynthesis
VNTNDNTLRVANILLDARFGGPQNRVFQVAEKLKQHGVETVVVIPRHDSDYFHAKLVEKQIQVRQLRLHRLTTADKSHLIGWFIFFVPEIIALTRLLKQERIRLVHCNSSSHMKGVIAGRLAGAKVIWHLNDSWVPKPVKVLFNILAPLANGFIVTGQRVRSYYLNSKRFSKQSTVGIQAPVDPRTFDPANTTADTRILETHGLKITMVSMITPSKGIEDFIDMARILSQKHNNVSFHIVGPELRNYEAYSKSLIKMVRDSRMENVFFDGRSDDVASTLKATDIFVCPSLKESGPMVVWEAMAMSKPIVSTDVGDVAIYIKDGASGFVVPTRDASALAEKVSILINDSALRVSFGSLARETALKELDVDTCALKHQNFYRKILASG